MDAGKSELTARILKEFSSRQEVAVFLFLKPSPASEFYFKVKKNILNGQYWARTSDFRRVKATLYH